MPCTTMRATITLPSFIAEGTGGRIGREELRGGCYAGGTPNFSPRRLQRPFRNSLINVYFTCDVKGFVVINPPLLLLLRVLKKRECDAARG